MTTRPSPLEVTLLGFGAVGTAVARILSDTSHPSLRLRAICTRRVDTARRGAPWANAGVLWTDRFDEAMSVGTPVVIELVGGVEPARTWITAALSAGRSVVTANKQVVAEHGAELIGLARVNGCALRFEAAVGGAIPILRGLQSGLSADRLTRIAGIVNGTTNFVLGRMERDGVSLDDAVADAQTRGYAEADPAADLDGFDARAKLVILTALGFGTYVKPSLVSTTSIRGTSPDDFVYAASLGRVIRQVAWVERGAPGTDGVTARVGPALVRRESVLARATGPRNCIVCRGERSGDTVFIGEGAGGEATAVSVVSDLLAIAHGAGVPRPWPLAATEAGRGGSEVRLPLVDVD